MGRPGVGSSWPPRCAAARAALPPEGALAALGRPGVGSGFAFTATSVRSATRMMALRARGLAATSAALGRTRASARSRVGAGSAKGARRSTTAREWRAMNCLTMRSSSEWKLITTSRPPGCRTCRLASSACSSSSSSALTKIRTAWNVRVAGCCPGSRVRTAPATSSANSRVRATG